MTEKAQNSVKYTLEERGTRYGRFACNADTAQELKAVLRTSANWYRMPAYKREALEMIAHKMARIVNGDPDYADSWHDIQGYARLGQDVTMDG